MRFLSKKFLFVIIVSLLILGGWLLYTQMKKDYVLSTVKINNIIINIELAQTLNEKTQGLSNRDFLDKNEGMLFVYDVPDFYSFWMKDMKFPIDIIWIDKDHKIVDLHKNVLPESYPQRFQPKNPAQYILEVNAGFCEKHNIQIGDFVDFL